MAIAANDQDSDRVDEWTKPPFLRRVRIQGYKSIAFCDVRLQPLTILVGRNGAGKSNFLDALTFLRDAMTTGVADAFTRRGGWPSIACKTTGTRKIVFEIETAFACGGPYRRVNGGDSHPSSPPAEGAFPNFQGNSFLATYNLELVGGATAAPTIEREALVIRNEVTNALAEFEVKAGIITRERSTPRTSIPVPLPHSRELFTVYRPDLPLLSVIGSQPFIDMGEGLRAMGFYNFHADAIRRLQKPTPGSLLERDGSNLASVIEGLKEIDLDSLERIRDYLSIIAEEVRHFESIRYGEFVTIRFGVRSAPESTPLNFDAASMSDGTLRTLAALIAAFQVHLPIGPTVIGIEEPETSLHPGAAGALVDALDEATSRTQILLTTHSADLLADRDIGPSHLLVVRMRAGQTQIAPVNAAAREIVRRELCSLADLHRMSQLEPDEADLERQAKTNLSDGEE
jgi:predicted ATPase